MVVLLFFFFCFRGKCSVALLNETESVLSYLDKEVSALPLFCILTVYKTNAQIIYSFFGFH